MNVSAALDWLFSTQFFGIKLGLDNTEKLLAAAGADRINATVVHVAGTNGKGSTCAMIEALARAQGYVTGLFTSPHLVDFSERIRVNGDMITPDALAEEISFLKQLAEGWEQPPTFLSWLWPSPCATSGKQRELHHSGNRAGRKAGRH